jgi:hypothetical protein
MMTPSAGRVRPYAITGGRTRPDHPLTTATVVVVENYDPARSVDLPPESHAIYERAVRPVAVSDLLAGLPAVPPTTVLVLLGDLIDAGLVRIEGDPADPTERDMLGRILAGLKELSP